MLDIMLFRGLKERLELRLVVLVKDIEGNDQERSWKDSLSCWRYIGPSAVEISVGGTTLVSK